MEKLDIIEYMPNPFKIYDYLIVAIISLALIVIFYKLIIYFKNLPQNPKKLLKSIEINSKDELFKFSKLAQKIDNSNRLKILLEELEEYKYSPNNIEIPDKLKEKIKEYIKDVTK